MTIRSIRTKFLLLVAGVALALGLIPAAFELNMSGQLLREQMVKRGRYIAQNLAYNSKYGVLTEDKPLLTQLLEGALSAGSDRSRLGTSDVVGAMIRDGKGAVLAQRGAPIRELPAAPATKIEERDTTTEQGEPVILFRAPVTSDTGSGIATELGLADGAPRPNEELKGGVEVAISKSVMAAQQQRNFLESSAFALLLFALGSTAGWYLIGRWLAPVRRMLGVATAVTKGDLTETLEGVESVDELGTLALSFKDMVANLRKIVDNIQETSVQVASSAGQISANAKLITQGAQSQAQAAEETSTSMEEMAASIQTVAGNSQSLATYVEETSSSITQMGASIEEVAKSSSTLATSSIEVPISVM